MVGLVVFQANLACAEPKPGDAPAQYQAQVTVMTAEPGKPWTTIAEPRVLFTLGSDAQVHIAGEAHEIRLKISTPQAGKAQFLFDATVIANPTAKTPNLLASPRLLLEPGKAGKIQVGDVLRIEATIEKVAGLK